MCNLYLQIQQRRKVDRPNLGTEMHNSEVVLEVLWNLAALLWNKLLFFLMSTSQPLICMLHCCQEVHQGPEHGEHCYNNNK